MLNPKNPTVEDFLNNEINIQREINLILTEKTENDPHILFCFLPKLNKLCC